MEAPYLLYYVWYAPENTTSFIDHVQYHVCLDPPASTRSILWIVIIPSSVFGAFIEFEHNR